MKKIITLLIIFVLTQGHAFTNESANVWVIGDCHKIDPVTGKDFNPLVPKDIAKKNYLWDSRTNTVTIFGARNESVSFQIIIEAANENLNNVTVKTSDLIGPDTIGIENIRLFKEHYTKVYKKSDWPLPSTGLGDYPDALIPFETPRFGAPFSIPANRNQAVWVDIFIPKDIMAGEYLGNFSIIVGANKIKEAQIKLAVLDFALPSENHLIFWSNYDIMKHVYGYENGDPRYSKVEESIWKISHEHRLNALLRHAHIRPIVNFNEYGQLLLNYQDYGLRLGKYLNGSLFKDGLPPDIFLLPISGGTEYRWPGNGPLNDPDYYFAYACKDFVAYFKEMGWGGMLGKSYIYLSDETDSEGLDKIVYDAKIIHDADKRLKTMVALFKVFSPETVKKLSGSVDMWLVDASYYNSKMLLPRKKMGEKIGFYQQGEPWCGNESLDSDGLGFVTWPWIAWKYGADCIYLYHMSIWWGGDAKRSIWDYPHNQTWSNSQGVLIYPGNYVGQDEVVGSIRLKQIRRGMQDYEYMHLAKQKGANPDPIVNSIIVRALEETRRPGGSYGEWSHDPKDWFLARINLANLILGNKQLPVKPSIPGISAADKQTIVKSSIKKTLKNLWSHLPKKLRNPQLLFLGRPNYSCNFSDGKEDGWYGGKITYKGNQYILEAVPKENGQFLWLELWKIFPVRQNTSITFSYFYEGDESLIVQFWSKTYKRNFSKQIAHPVKGRWETISYDLKDINPELTDTQINSIHIATLNKPGTVLMIDNITLE